MRRRDTCLTAAPPTPGLLLAACLALLPLAAGCSPPVADLRSETVQGETRIYNGQDLLAVYSHTGNTFTQFWVYGSNLLGGFSSGTPGSNAGGPMKGHSADYPFGHISDAAGNKLQWEGFWAGFNYIDVRWMFWTGIAGNPLAQCSFSVEQPRNDLVVLHVTTQVPFCFDPLFQCEVDYFVKPQGIGVKSVVTVLKELQPLGADDTGGQLLMSQVDCDLDPAQPYQEANQPDLYYKLALNDAVVAIDPFPPAGGYNTITPSNIYADQNIPAPPQNRVNPLPDTALVPSQQTLAFISPFGRPGSNLNLALRIDLAKSTLPPLEYYCEYNGERDYLNFLLSPAIGLNRSVKTVPQGTTWVMYGDMVPWVGTDPKVLYSTPLLYE